MKNSKKYINFICIKIILFYKKYISPYKGFKCAHAHYLKGESCSTYGLNMFKKHNFTDAYKYTYERLNACSYVSKIYQNNLYISKYKNGFIDCDIDCIGCKKIDSILEIAACLDVFNREDTKPLTREQEKKSPQKNKFILIQEMDMNNVYKHYNEDRLFLINKSIKKEQLNLEEKDILKDRTIYSKSITIEEFKKSINAKNKE